MVRNLEAKAQRAAEEAERRAKSTLNNAHLEKGNTQWGTDAVADDGDLDPEKVKAAIKKLERQEREAAQAGEDERKRKFNSLAADADGEMTAEEMEAYRLKKGRGEDPAAAFRDGGSGTDGYDML
jgi:pre-mRNA-processing factor SLU7